MAGNRPSSAAVGFTFFAATMMMLVGVFHATAGLIGILDDENFLVTPNYVFKFDTTTWGWIHLIVGLVVVLAGFGLLQSKVWARTVAVILAGISAVANFVWLPYAPFWAITMIAVNVTVIWAVTVHGRDITQD